MAKFWSVVFILIGFVWLFENYIEINVPLVPVLLIFIGLWGLLKHKEEKKK